MILKGKVWKFGSNINTDVIIPGRYLRTFNPDDLSAHVMEGERSDFALKVQKGDFIVGDWNFGCGSSREQATIAIKNAGVNGIIAKSFARIFYRNAINIGLPVIIADIDVDEGDIIKVDLKDGVIYNLTTDKSFKIKEFKDFLLNILLDGGLVNHYTTNIK
ncbi:MAG: 3-isopropylmalate dehydratase small subunit [Methanobrevibacter sp.]|jgi:methanogen homoaconitase small subunit|nr:3-isopropylmalate dehydratase small subunit [Candidatus Methanovirga meridionalis]